MTLKKLKTPSGASTVITTTKNYDEYISLGYVFVEDVEVAMEEEEAEREDIRFKLDGSS